MNNKELKGKTMKQYDGLGLSDVLALGKEDLLQVLVTCGISCRSCYKNAEHKGWIDGGITCGEKFISAPELSCCMEWREGRTESEIKEGPKLYERLDKDKI